MECHAKTHAASDFSSDTGRLAEAESPLPGDFQAKQAELVETYEKRRTSLLSERDAARIAEDEQYHDKRKKLIVKLDHAARKIRRRHKERLRDARDTRDRLQRDADERFKTANHRLNEGLSCRAEICSLQRQAVEEMRQRLLVAASASPGTFADDVGERWTDDATAHPRRRFARAMQRAEEEMSRVQSYLRLKANLKPAGIALAVASGILTASVLGFVLNWTGWIWIVGAAIAGPAVLLAIAYAAVVPAAKRKGEKAYRNCRHAVSHAEDAVAELFTAARQKFDPLLQAAPQRRENADEGASQQWKQTANTLKLMRDKRLEENKQKVSERQAKLENDHRRRVNELAQEYLPQLESLAHDHERAMAELVKWQQQELTEAGNVHSGKGM